MTDIKALPDGGKAKFYPASNPLDWPEDFEHENGIYSCRCVQCEKGFTGHKRRVVCKACTMKSLVSELQHKTRALEEIIKWELAADCDSAVLKIAQAAVGEE